jgi:hypothetical protein
MNDLKSSKPIYVSTFNVFGIIATTKSGKRLAWNLGPTHKVDSKKYGQIDGPICDVVAGHETGKKPDLWFLVCNVDCFSPPQALIQADSFEEALEILHDECERYIKVEAPDLAGYLKPGMTDADEDCYVDYLSWNSNGTPIDTENVHIEDVAEIVFIKRIDGGY